MIKYRLIIVLLLLLALACGADDAFTKKALDFEAKIVLENGAVRVLGKTNLPDGFLVFLDVEPAPQYLVQAQWAGECRVTQGRFSFDTIFTDPLPYRATLILGSAINPEYQKEFTGKKLPFTLNPDWNVQYLASEQFQISRVIKETFGTPKQHAAVLQPAVDELSEVVRSMGNELKTLQKLPAKPDYGYARFMRLHLEKASKAGLDQKTTSFYYPRTFALIKNANKHLTEHFLFLLADFEKDTTERKKHDKAQAKIRKDLDRIRKKIDELQKTFTVSAVIE